MIKNVGTVSVFVSDQQRAKAFYTDVLDLELRRDEPLYPGSPHRWIAVAPPGAETEISVRLVDEQEMTALNKRYRDQAGSTNVLSFPSDLPAELELPLLGDIVICAAVVRTEAAEQGKGLSAHWAHMTIHGTLHLLGYDHLVEEQATHMEALETAILQRLNYPCPYPDSPPLEHSS